MRSPLEFGPLAELEEVDSTQDILAAFVRAGEPGSPAVVLARNQTKGRGRMSRTWLSSPGDSLTMSMAMFGQADFREPWLVGMAVAVCSAEALGLAVQWPNDLCWDGRKVGGILTEIVKSAYGASVPIIGLGINLNQESFEGEIASTAASLFQRDGIVRDARKVADLILGAIAAFPEPESWSSFAHRWHALDQTPGKVYVDLQGRRVNAKEVGEGGKLVGTWNGETTEVLAADALRCR